MSNYNTTLQSNNTDLQAILNTINELPEAGSSSGVTLPALTNEGSASNLLSGKQLIDQEGNIITGTFTIDTELSTQDNLISQIQNAVNELPDANSGGGSFETCTLIIDSKIECDDNVIVSFTRIINDTIVATAMPCPNNSTVTIDNILCNSLLNVDDYLLYMISGSYVVKVYGADPIPGSSRSYSAPPTSDGTITIIIS